jgi:hypothetical protein
MRSGRMKYILIAIRKSYIRLFGYGILLISIIAFLLTWIRMYIGIPTSVLLLIGYYILCKDIVRDKSEIYISKKKLLLLCGIMIAWTIFSGLGGAFPQKNDLQIRNAILHDLINYPWPVRYSDGYDSSLTYYIAFWIIPALIGKLTNFFLGAQAAWVAANIAYAFYCVLILCVVMLLLVSYLNATSLKRMSLVAIILIFFSGMDIVPIILAQLGDKTISIGTHLEWWTTIQYSSNTTQLSWVYNQAVPAWLVTALLFHECNIEHFAFLGLLLLPFGPIPFIGVFFVMILQGAVDLIQSLREKKLLIFLKQIPSIPNIIAILTIVPIYYLYYSTNTATSDSGFASNSGSLSFVTYCIFIFIEFLMYVILSTRKFYKKRYYLVATIGLFLTPFFNLGGAQDFCMRASIPFLFILMVYIIEYLLQSISFNGKDNIGLNSGAVIMIILLTIGSATPLTEFRQSLVQIAQSGGARTSLIADDVKTLDNGDMDRGNFITMHASDTLFYRYLAKNNNGQ